MKRITILGATGSIGQNTLDLIGRAPEAYEVIALTGGRNIAQLAQDAKAMRADVAVTAHDELLDDLRAALAGSDVQAAAGQAALCEAGARPADWVMSAIVGVAGLKPGLAALEQGATLALANKESLVAAGPLMLRTARQNNARILPVDSEHSAIFQALTGEDMAAVKRVIITASGGAFRDWPLEDMAQATLAQASSHPNWNMGQRITIDSASMFNKALEIIEAREFFGFEPDQIEVLLHPQSLIHALVGYRDGALMAHIGPHDMRHAIGYALNWPERRELPVEALDLVAIGTLNFQTPDLQRYPALRLAREVMRLRGLSGAVFNAAKERALDHFIAGRIGFTDMNGVVETVLSRSTSQITVSGDEITLDHVTKTDHLARMSVDQVVRDEMNRI
ncbi:1-deoxy-D-xylulose 5-phosphate reductoisomerase [hydrothermal vent metagenome]|uniref:1-deoxy-D-xylulose-5-phosphate reductoisomerase n=1 Tax=hydrothermal vent metagenome TaxID=652676 RepID=A0A3B0S3U8_9ZZZZ